MVKLSADEKKHLLPFRPGGEVIVALIADLAEKYNIHLADMPVEGMRNDLAASQMLAPLVSKFSLIAAWGEDTMSVTRSESWQSTTGNYSVLSRVSEANASLATELKPAREFFAQGPRKKAPKGDGTT
jgi:hypothetical protein